MNYFVSFTLAIACVSLIAATSTVPTTGSFFVTSFGTSATCASASVDTTLQFAATATCLDTSSTVGGSFTTSSWDGKTLGVSAYSTSDCSGTADSTITTLTCDGSCSQVGTSGNYAACVYSNIPTTSAVLFGDFTGAVCGAANLDTSRTGFYTTANPCWSLSSTYSVLPTAWNGSTQTFDVLEFSGSSACNSATSTAVPTASIKCDGKCHAEADSTTSYMCTYLSSAKLIVSLVLSFAIMLILV
jgi:hypothetical protein